MFPVLFSIGRMPVSSYGVSLAIGILIGVFLIWRLTRAWDLDEEKILDLTLLTFLGGLIGARFYFAFFHLDQFHDIFNIFQFNKFPGFSFWGSLLGGFSTLYVFAKRQKIDFWMMADIASIGLLSGLIFSSIGCFLSGCDVGIPSKILSVSMIGWIGKRFPIQILEAILLIFVLSRLWSSSLHFHQRGKILSLSLIYIAVINILITPFKALDENLFPSVGLLILGIYVFYKITKRRLKSDIKSMLFFVRKFFTDPETRKLSMERLRKYWYNQKTQVWWSLRNLKKGLKKFNVRLSYKNN